MRQLPFDIGTIHFIGIGGIGMSGIAEILLNLGYSVSGSDVNDSANIRRLRTLGIDIAIGHDPANLRDASVVVASSAIRPDNPEVVKARSELIPVVPRAEMLAEIMQLKWAIAVAGTHGKTTTTSIIAAVLDAGRFDPTIINGGIINAYGTNARLGTGDWIVVEADESDGTFVKLPATIAVTTNIDPEHLDHYGDFASLKDAFVSFIQNIPFYGFATLCIDDPDVQALISRITDRRIVTYGFSPQADFRAANIQIDASGSRFRLLATDHVTGRRNEHGVFEIPMVGEHNVRNALAAVAIARELGIDMDTVRSALADFSGVRRRFTRTGTVGGVTIIDDYGHHPVEISAVLGAARVSSSGKIIAVVQPHRYSRVAHLFESFCTCFNDADTVIVSPIYSAGEEALPGISQATLIDGLRSRGHRDVVSLTDPTELPGLIAGIASPGDLVIFLGAGSITQWAHSLPGALARLWDVEQTAMQGGV